MPGDGCPNQVLSYRTTFRRFRGGVTVPLTELTLTWADPIPSLLLLANRKPEATPYIYIVCAECLEL